VIKSYEGFLRRRLLVRQSLAWVLALLFVLTVASFAPATDDLSDLDADGLPGVAEPPADASMEPEVFALGGTGSILIDRSHYENFNVNGFVGFLQSQGWTVATNTAYPITRAILMSYDIVLIPVGNASLLPFSTDEVAAFYDYLWGGGGLWLFNDYNTNPAGINSLAAAFGLTFQFDTVFDYVQNEGLPTWPRIMQLASHSIFEGVSSYGCYGGCCLTVVPPAQLLASASADAYSYYCPSAPPVLALYESTESTGRVVFSADITPLHPSYYPGLLREEEELLLQNIANWLVGFPPTGATTTSWGTIKARYR
jgi:hypothetical protein